MPQYVNSDTRVSFVLMNICKKERHLLCDILPKHKLTYFMCSKGQLLGKADSIASLPTGGVTLVLRNGPLKDSIKKKRSSN